MPARAIASDAESEITAKRSVLLGVSIALVITSGFANVIYWPFISLFGLWTGFKAGSLSGLTTQGEGSFALLAALSFGALLLDVVALTICITQTFRTTAGFLISYAVVGSVGLMFALLSFEAVRLLLHVVYG